MSILFVMMMASAMKRTGCPECGAECGADADFMRALGG
jgi:hypothetical protein